MPRSRARTASTASPPTAPAEPPDPASHARRRAFDRAALVLLAAFAVAMTWTQITEHPTPLYTVETDLISDFIPAARNLRAGALSTEHYQFKGFGYPLALAAASFLTRDDYYLAARLLNVASAVAGGAFTYLLFRGFLGAAAGLFVLIGLLVNPVFLRATIEAGTDMPAFALAIAAAFLLLGCRSRRALFASGFVAGYAVITRYNALFLLGAALPLLLARPGRARNLLAYAAGLALPIGSWMLANDALTGSALNTRNYANIAYEVYGQGTSWDEFASHTLSRFQSLGDVIRFDPGRFASRIGVNLATRWWRDVRELVPPWIGLLAIPGLVLGWRGRRGAGGFAIHFALCYVTLAVVFYAPRFSLFLIPFYLSGAVALLLLVRLPARALRQVILSVLLVASAIQAVAGVHAALAKAPHEVRIAGALLRSSGHPGERVMARKPHVAYFAGMDFVALPVLYTLPELVQAGRASGARYLFFSPIEAALRVQFTLLSDSGVTLPGLAPIAHQVLDSTRYFALYRFTDEPIDPAAFRDSTIAALRRAAQRRPGEAWPHVMLAGHLIEDGHDADALPALALAEGLAPADPMVARMQSVALYHLRDYEAAAQACERAMRLGSSTAWEHAHLGHIRLAQARYAEARDQLRAAVALEPARVEFVLGLARAYFHTAELPAAAREVEKVLAMDPGNRPARALADSIRSE